MRKTHTRRAAVVLAATATITGLLGASNMAGPSSAPAAASGVSVTSLLSDATTGPGQSQDWVYNGVGGIGTYRTYVPASYESHASRGPVPLLVNIHGCATPATEHEAATEADTLAEREGVVVLYPNTGSQGLLHCWDWANSTRGVGDAALIVGMVREVMQRYRIDRQRVYVVGMSAGAM